MERNCNTCKSLMTCEILLKEYLKLGDDFHSKHEFRKGFICDNYKSIYIEYPIEVSKINQDTNKGGYRDRNVGKFVSIRPCGEQYQNKTYLGLYLGDLPIGHYITYNPETKELNVSFRNNPAIFVFDLKKIIYGYESWWGIIENEADLKEITDLDIDNIWYVKALKALSS